MFTQPVCVWLCDFYWIGFTKALRFKLEAIAMQCYISVVWFNCVYICSIVLVKVQVQLVSIISDHSIADKIKMSVDKKGRERCFQRWIIR